VRPGSAQELARRKAPALAQTNQAWDRGVELRDEERSELERLGGTVAGLREQLDQARDSLRMSRRRERDATEALRERDEGRLWQRWRIRTVLRNRESL
jgi:hypothetical protein